MQAYDVTNQTAAAAVNTAQDTAARTYNATTDAANTAYYKTAETADAVKGATQVSSVHDNTTSCAVLCIDSSRSLPCYHGSIMAIRTSSTNSCPDLSTLHQQTWHLRDTPLKRACLCARSQDTAYRAYDNANIAAQKTKAAAANGVNAAAGAAAGAVQGAKVGAYSAQRVPVTDTGLAADVAESQVNKGTAFEGTGGRVVGQNRRY